MALYLITLLIMGAGASVLAFIRLRNARQLKGMSLYDARGFYFIAMVFITFLLTSLAYFWGESRFGGVEPELHPISIGILVNLLACLACLGLGLIKLKE